MTDNMKSFSRLVYGIVCHDYYDDSSMTDELLKQELFPDLPQEQFSALCQKLRGLLKSMATTDMDQAQAESFLNAQKRKSSAAATSASLTEDQMSALLKFWSSHRERIHVALVETLRWSNKMADFSWRVDVKTNSKTSSEGQKNCAVVQMNLENKEQINGNKKSEMIQFELDETGMNKVMTGLKEIESLIEKHNQSSTSSNHSDRTVNGAVS